MDKKMNEKKILFKEESYRIMGACFEVYNEKGNGFLESVYHECLGIEFEMQNIAYLHEPKIELFYKGRRLTKTYEPDFICFQNILLEIKVVKGITNEHRAQVINYLKSTGRALGLLVNFGHESKLEYERFVNKFLEFDLTME